MTKKTTNGDETPSTLDALRVQTALGGKAGALALLHSHVAANGGEQRPQQEQMVTAVADAIKTKKPLLVQAGTGTGKSLAYLFPLAAAERRGVIATATNQLSDQLLRHDLPLVQAVAAAGGHDITFAALKGRNQYACLARIAEIEMLDAAAADHEAPTDDRLFDLDEDPAPARAASAAARRQAQADSKEVATLIAWSKRTKTGERTEAPACSDRAWNKVSTSAADCPGAASCPFSDKCFSERARAVARSADIVVTNHALLAQDIRAALDQAPVDSDNAAPGTSMFGKHDAVIVDEAHDLPSALTGALSTDVDPRALTKFLTKAARQLPADTTTADGESALIAGTRTALADFDHALHHAPEGPLPDLPAGLNTALSDVVTSMLAVVRALVRAGKDAERAEQHKKATAVTVLATQGEQLLTKLIAAQRNGSGDVRWVERRRDNDDATLKTAPLEVGWALRAALNDRTLIATSATLTTGHDFTPIARALDHADATTVDVGSPFDYPKQGMLYIPRNFPEPVGRDRTAHTEAVQNEVTELVRAAGGRALLLFTTTAAAHRAADHLREQLPHLNVLAHGDAPADVLVSEFAADETSVLCATMGLWQGVSVDGAACSLVVIDKVAFAPVDDVLTAARRRHTDAQGRDGFTEVVVAGAATSLAQAVGRLIRTRTDRGVVAILDPRLHTKGYGRTLLAGLPPFKVFTDHDIVIGALHRLTGGPHPEPEPGTAVKAAPKRGSHTRREPRTGTGRSSEHGKKPAASGGVPRRASSTRALGRQTRRT